ncbi:MAG: hypothetical protein DMG60_20760 [Acidobacteria bacterium]|nr:MAG: hypothetical protein DMG60_20760 [Acidobacteriota bacterium]
MILEFDLQIIEFCPKYANLLQRQGNNREVCKFLSKPIIQEHLTEFRKGIQKNNREPAGNFCSIMGLLPTADLSGRDKRLRRRLGIPPEPPSCILPLN